MYGAILGDIIGSPFEFREIRQKSKNFELFSKESKFTDDTVMTIAVADAILRTGNEKDGRILFKNVEKAMLRYGKKYPHAGYGGGFRRWLKSENPKPYNSFGNGSAMRVSAAGWIYRSMFDTRECARMTARPTHNHPEGVKGAMAVASAIFLARNNVSKEEIKNYIEFEFGYDLSRSLDVIRQNYNFDVTCQGSVPEAIIAFLESENFEDAIRNAVSLGGDTDTQAAIAGSIAEAFYGIPDDLIKKCREYLPKEFLEVIDKFYFCKSYFSDDLENDSLEEKIAEFNKISSEKNYRSIKDEIFHMLQKNNPTGNELWGFFSTLEEIKNDGQTFWQPDIFEKDGKDYDVLFTNISEVAKHKHIKENSQLAISDITEIFRVFEEVYLGEEIYGGLAINPYGKNPFFLTSDDLKEILNKYKTEIAVTDDKPKNLEFTRKYLSNDLLTKKFFADAKFIHTSASGAMGDAGVVEVWNKNFEHYYCHWIDGFDVEKFNKFFMKDVKNGWCFHYMGCGNNFYIKEELNEEYLRKFEEGQKNGANYPFDEDVFPVEEVMLKVLTDFDEMNNFMKNSVINLENSMNKFELNDNIIVYRRANISLLNYFEKNLQFDGIFQDDGFISTTALEIGSNESEIEISVIVPKGKGYGAYIAPLSEFPDECEFLLNRGTLFKVREVDKENFKVVIEAVGRGLKELD